MSRLKRIAAMSWPERTRKVRFKLTNLLSPRKNLRRLAHTLESWSLKGNEGRYKERPEYGPVNIESKLARVAAGGPFEPRDITLVNKLAVRLVGHPKNVLEVGCGTAMFSSMLADKFPDVRIVASEFQDETREWAVNNRARPNIEFCKKYLTEFPKDQFDLCIALEVVEHIDDYATFLNQISQVAPKAIISTPNKFRTWYDYETNTPEFDQHVREWSAGEFYWVLRCFWKKVEIHTIPNITAQMAILAKDKDYEPTSKLTGVHCREHAMIAVCENPLDRSAT
jgi:2-polyprenyl-3-methyl-5-hydroxy-6-metoxy-1,4-benzoquinol methylase